MKKITGGSSYKRGGKTHYELNKEYYKLKAKRNKEKSRALIKAAKDIPCADCKIKYPFYVMDYDHISPDKKFDLGGSWMSMGYQQIEEEIKKCEVVCSNCHRIRTYNRNIAPII